MVDIEDMADRAGRDGKELGEDKVGKGGIASDRMTDGEQAREIAQLLVEWYRVNRRDLPWRDQKRWSQAAYAVRGRREEGGVEC